MKHLLSIADLGAEGLKELLDLTDRFAEIGRRPIPKVPALRGKTVATLFYEDSTRTRLSFETAAKRLSADTMNVSVSTSSVQKGESIRDTVETVSAMGANAFVIRHRSAGVPHQVTQWTDAHIINAGDGWHEHPTQALLDAYTLRQTLGEIRGRHIAIVGDIKHSRVARSDVTAFALLGAEITLVAPPTLLPPSLEGWPVHVSHDLDQVIPKVDAIYVLRVQQERITDAVLPSLREYSAGYGLNLERAQRLPSHAPIMHPGPMIRGVEITSEAADLPNTVVTNQVTNGVSVRMAVLYLLIGSGVDLSSSGGANSEGDTSVGDNSVGADTTPPPASAGQQVPPSQESAATGRGAQIALDGGLSEATAVTSSEGTSVS